MDPSVPLFGFIGRLEEQKGVDILLAALPKVLAKGNVQVVVLGTGKKKFEQQVTYGPLLLLLWGCLLPACTSGVAVHMFAYCYL